VIWLRRHPLIYPMFGPITRFSQFSDLVLSASLAGRNLHLVTLHILQGPAAGSPFCIRLLICRIAYAATQPILPAMAETVK
jgi:hypothetical protein